MGEGYGCGAQGCGYCRCFWCGSVVVCCGWMVVGVL